MKRGFFLIWACVQQAARLISNGFKGHEYIKTLVKDCFRKPLQKEQFKTSNGFVKALVKGQKNPLFYAPPSNSVVDTHLNSVHTSQNICEDMPELSDLKAERIIVYSVHTSKKIIYSSGNL